MTTKVGVTAAECTFKGTLINWGTFRLSPHSITVTAFHHRIPNG
jgi:hypothetical protein